MRGGMRANACISFGVSPDALMDLWMRRLNEHGVRSFWLYDVLYGIDNFARLARIAKQYGSEVVGTVFYTISPVHTDSYLAAKAAEIAAVPEIDGVLFYDTAGVLDAERLRDAAAEDRRRGGAQAGRDPRQQPDGHLGPDLRRSGQARGHGPAHGLALDGQRALGPLDRERRPQPRADGGRARHRHLAAGAGRGALPRGRPAPPGTWSTRSASTTSSTSPTRSRAGWSGRSRRSSSSTG